MNLENEKNLTPSDIKSIRKGTGLTQKEFSEVFSINLNTLRHWEKGDRKPNASTIVLLELINKCGIEICSILKKPEDINMSESKGKDFLKDVFYHKKYLTLGELANSLDPNLSEAILALIAANGYLYKESKEDDKSLLFFAGHTSDSLQCVLTIDKESGNISGDLKNLIEKTYLTIFGLEKDLRDAIYWSQEIRKNKIEKLISDLGISTEFYSHILKNW
ncbi:helix-turn-helix domain-containing protein [Aeromonas salmonicida]|uniref:helix-turn-helix domain-containing protein n=1 Tax=Aeromonas salmonicida TaxID=645 RepID=UPI0038B6C0E3